MPVKHKFVSAKSDGGDATLVRPSNWNDDHEGNSLTALIVAANDSSAADKDKADFVCDGTDDGAEIQSAIDAMPTRGGDIILAPGRYDISTTIPTITENKRIHVYGAGALLFLATGATGIKIEQGSTGGNTRGAFVHGLRVDGNNAATTIGVNFTDTNWSGLVGVQIENCAIGILMHAETANEFVEGITLEDVVIRNCATYGIELRRTSGTNSFGQHAWRNVSINCSTGSGRIGLLIPTGVSVYRSRLEVGVWITSDQTAVSLDGDFDNAVLDLFVEGATGSTGNTAVLIGSNATNLERMEWHYSIWGTINTNITNASSKLAMYKQGRRFYGVGGAAPIQGYVHGNSGATFFLETGGPQGGRLTLGSAGGTLQDVAIQRGGADILQTPDKFDPEDLNLPNKAGTPVDGDVIGGAADGDVIFDTSGKLVYVRMAGSWVAVNTPVVSRGGTVFNPDGITAAANIIVWRAPFACTVTNVRGYRVGGSGATINARRNGSSNHLSTAVSLTSADTWTDGGAVQNTAYAVGDKLEIMVVSATGSPTQVAVQVDFTRP